jgi:MFS family permease
MFWGVGIFLAGSVLCGLAWSMPALIASRALQGIGAGAVHPVATTIVGDTYTVEERARVQGYLASVWFIAAMLGPTLGGLFSEYLSWRWIFLVNVPLGAVAVWMLARHFHEHVERRKHALDYPGAVLLASGCGLAIVGLLEGGASWAWRSVPGIGAFAGAFVLLLAFVLVERRAKEPVLPFWVFRRRILGAGNAVVLCVGAIVIGMNAYVPTFAQSVLGAGPVMAGFVLAMLAVMWPLAAAFSGRVYLRIGFRDTSLVGSVVVLLGVVLCTFLSGESHLWHVAALSGVVGLGLGLMFNPTIVAVQDAVGWQRRGVVTGTAMFSRAIGSSLGVAVFGAIVNVGLPDDVDRRQIASGGKEVVNQATHHVFIALVVIAACGVVATFCMPRKAKRLTFD